MKLSPNGKALKKAIDPFQRVVRLNAPIEDTIPTDASLREVIPGVWPSWEDLKRLVKAVEAVLADEVVVGP